MLSSEGFAAYGSRRDTWIEDWNAADIVKCWEPIQVAARPPATVYHPTTNGFHYELKRVSAMSLV